jgi:glycosyltransferase involved in cell wall biosynthesis
VLAFNGGAAWKHLRTAGVPYLFAVHGGAVLDREVLQRNAAHLRRSDTLIVNCRSDEAILGKLFAGPTPRVCRLRLPAHELCFSELERSTARAALPWHGEPDLVVGFIARLLPQKNFHQFLVMFSEVAERLAPRRVEAVVIGQRWTDYPVLPYVTESYAAHIADLVATLGLRDRVVYLGGGLDDEDLRLVYGSMDLLIHPTSSIDENFGYVPVEAMACGVPVVGAAYGGLKDSIVHEETGYLMPTWTTPSGLRMDLIGGTDAAVSLLNDTQRRELMSEAARAHARRTYNRETCARELVEAVRGAVRAQTPERVSPASPLRTPEPAGYLPALPRGWEYYWPMVDEYVSGPLPTAGSDTRVRLGAPVRQSGDVLELLDPAWPARFPVGAEELAICEKCRRTVRVRDLDAKPGTVASLIQKGVLIASQ